MTVKARRAPLPLPGVLVAATTLAGLLAWPFSMARMSGMDMGPGTPLGGALPYAVTWVLMMTAMMLPSAAPLVLSYARVAHHRVSPARAGALTMMCVAGYLGAWLAFGMIAWLVDALARAHAATALRWEAQGRLIVALTLVSVGVYQLTPAKSACLRRCRSPLTAIMRGFSSRPVGVLRLGATNGAWCIGCCAGLMIVLFALGVMSVPWMAVLSAAIAAEKLLLGTRGARILASLLIIGGLTVALWPSLLAPARSGHPAGMAPMMRMTGAG